MLNTESLVKAYRLCILDNSKLHDLCKTTDISDFIKLQQM